MIWGDLERTCEGPAPTRNEQAVLAGEEGEPSGLG